jgi:ubiquinone biosynthesis protein
MRYALRSIEIALFVAAALVSYGARRVVRFEPERAEVDSLRGRALARLLERLGATFIKFGQIMSSRPDLLPAEYIDALAKLQDDVPAAPFGEVDAVIRADLSDEARDLIASIEERAVAAASVAQVHRAVLKDGRTVALKVQRRGAHADVERDLTLLGFMAALCDRIPSVRLLSLPGAVARFSVAMHAQLDFGLEAENNRRFAAAFAHTAGVAVPSLCDELCTRRVLAMEFVEGVRATDAEHVGGDRAELARLGTEAVLRMVFLDGFVHADLHPGNMMFASDGRLVLLDLGLVAEIPRDMLRPWCETFAALAHRDGRAASRLFYVHAPSVDTEDYAAFERDIIAFFDSFYDKRLGDVEVSFVIGGAMDVLRRHRVQIEPTFTVVNIALLVAEGVGKQLDPSLDLVAMAIPYLAQALTTAPEGRAPRRAIPI